MNSDPEREPTEPVDRIEPVDPTGPIGQQSHGPFRDGQRTVFESVFLRRGSAHVEVRAGWRAGLYVALFLLIFSILNVAGLFFQQRVLPTASPAAGGMTPVFLFRQELAMAASAILAALLMSLLERRRFGEYGMPLSGRFPPSFLAGNAVGIRADQRADAADSRVWRIFIRRSRHSRPGTSALRAPVGRFLCGCRSHGGISFSGLPAVHVDLGHGFLANCDAAFTRVLAPCTFVTRARGWWVRPACSRSECSSA